MTLRLKIPMKQKLVDVLSITYLAKLKHVIVLSERLSAITKWRYV